MGRIKSRAGLLDSDPTLPMSMIILIVLTSSALMINIIIIRALGATKVMETCTIGKNEKLRDKKSRLYCPVEVSELVNAYKRGGSNARMARDELVSVLQPLVKSVARRFAGVPQVEKEDLLQEGALGLMRALDLYNPAFGTAFTSYAYTFVMHYMQVSVRKSRVVRLPANIECRRSKYRTLQSTLANELNREPTIDELAQASGDRPGQVAAVLNIHTVSGTQMSVGGPDGKERRLFDQISDVAGPVPEEQVDRIRIQPKLKAMLRSLPPKQAEVIARVVGFQGEPASYADIARELGCSRQAVQRQAAQAR